MKYLNLNNYYNEFNYLDKLASRLFSTWEPFNLYEALGVLETASKEELKRKYRELAMTMHPDKFSGIGEDALKVITENFQRLSFAYSILSDDAKRREYDNYLSNPDVAEANRGMSDVQTEPYAEPRGFSYEDWFSHHYNNHINFVNSFSSWDEFMESGHGGEIKAEDPELFEFMKTYYGRGNTPEERAHRSDWVMKMDHLRDNDSEGYYHATRNLQNSSKFLSDIIDEFKGLSIHPGSLWPSRRNKNFSQLLLAGRSKSSLDNLFRALNRYWDLSDYSPYENSGSYFLQLYMKRKHNSDAKKYIHGFETLMKFKNLFYRDTEGDFKEYILSHIVNFQNAGPISHAFNIKNQNLSIEFFPKFNFEQAFLDVEYEDREVIVELNSKLVEITDSFLSRLLEYDKRVVVDSKLIYTPPIKPHPKVIDELYVESIYPEVESLIESFISNANDINKELFDNFKAAVLNEDAKIFFSSNYEQQYPSFEDLLDNTFSGYYLPKESLGFDDSLFLFIKKPSLSSDSVEYGVGLWEEYSFQPRIVIMNKKELEEYIEKNLLL